MFNINFPCVVLILYKSIKRLHTFWQCSALSITNEASNWTVSWSLINPDLTIRFTCASSCLHPMHESHCFLFSECVEGSKKSFLFHLHVTPTCSISRLYLCVWYSVLLIKALKISSRATITCNNSGTGALASCDRTRSPRGAAVLYRRQWWWMMNHATVQFTTAPLCLLNKLCKHPFAPPQPLVNDQTLLNRLLGTPSGISIWIRPLPHMFSLNSISDIKKPCRLPTLPHHSRPPRHARLGGCEPYLFVTINNAIFQGNEAFGEEREPRPRTAQHPALTTPARNGCGAAT